MRGGYPPTFHLGGPGDLPLENLESPSTIEAAFFSLFVVKVSGFKLNFESQFDISKQYFASISAYTGIVAGIQSKQKGNDQELTKYLINDCSSFWSMRVCELAYGLQTILSLAQRHPGPLKMDPR